MKRRTLSRHKEAEAIAALRTYCAAHGLVFQAEPREDYGVDCYIEVALKDSPQNFLVGVQSRAGRSYRRETSDPAEFKVDLDPSDVQYWLAANYPIFLVYYDDVSKHQFFKHIQDEWERPDRRNCQFLTLTDEDRIRGGNLAEYLRDLVEVTPNARNRLQVVARPLAIQVGSALRTLDPIKSKRIEDLTEHFRGCEENRAPHFEGAFLLGYSADENWSLESKFEPCGMTGFVAVTVFLHDLRRLRTLKFDILGWPDFEAQCAGKSFPSDEVRSRLTKAADAVERIGFFAPQILYRAQPRGNVDEFAGPPIYFAFGAETFEICISAEGGRQLVLFRNDKYRPPRITTLFAERIEPVVDFSIEVESPNHPTPIVGIMEVAASASGKQLGLTITTNAEHGCWGHPKSYVFNFETNRVREACRLALL